ncbi:MAG: NAD(P)/FAD-dependent oxidoreductase [Eubacteriales bacterium]
MKITGARFFGTECEKIDEKEQTVTLSDSRKLSYDRLLIATGSSPAVPPIDGLSTVQNKFTFMSLSDAEALEQALKPKSRVLILGAGLIGLKCAEGIAGLAGKITVVDLADRILPNVLDEDAAAIVQRQMENHGINFVLADGASRFEDKKAFLKSGREIEFDVLVVAVGVRPNTSLICNLGADAKRGIVTNNVNKQNLQTFLLPGLHNNPLTTGQNKILLCCPTPRRDIAPVSTWP